MFVRLLTVLAFGFVVHATEAASPALRVLFLGDTGPHRPADRAAQLIPVLANRGIDVTYTEDVAVLDRDFLARFDALLIYANIERMTPEQEAGLVGYVEDGGGFVAIHSASFCFQNSPAYIGLVGGQFRSHGTGEFETKVVAPEHPVMQDLRPFATWDETYVHDKHNPENRTVLQVRLEGGREEPWTWVRTQGRGRIFYTAYGHDERTWMQPGFHALVERGIRWTANRDDVFDSGPVPNTGLKPFEYAEALLPNYVPSEKWGAQGEPIRTMQLPVDPEESRKHLVVPPGFEPALFAAEPNVAKPVAMNWDERGRLWVLETFDYPNDLQRPGEGNDRIKICEDTDGDGVADTFTIFAENLSIPTSLAFAYGGVIVHQAPDTLFLKDTDGDGRADVRETLFTGWKTNDTHAGPSNLRYGHDGWYYGIVGYAGFEGTVAGEVHEFRQGFYRFKLEAPKTSEFAGDGSRVPHVAKFEFLRSVSNNAWGVGFSEEGLLFGSTANGCPSVFAAIPNRYYESVRGWSPPVLPSISPSNRFFPITDKVRQVDHHGGFTSAAGHALYTARVYPEQYWNRTAFVSDPTGHLTATFVLQPRGSDFVAYNSWNLVASDDEWTAPIVAEVGPDGNVWVIDWYNYVVQHNPTPHGFETGKGAAYITPLRDKRHGRIYRITYPGGEASPSPRLDSNDPQSLVAALGHPNLRWRLHAQRLLIEQAATEVVPQLVAAIREPRVDSTGLDAAATHAVWTLSGLNAADRGDVREAVVAALDHPSPAVRRAAVSTLPRDERSVDDLIASAVLSDAAPQVRLAALLALAEMPASEQAAEAASSALTDEELLKDVWLPDAVTAAAAAHAGSFLKAAASEEQMITPAAAIVTRVAEHFARSGQFGDLSEILVAASRNPAVADAILAGFTAGWPETSDVKLNVPAEKAMAELFPRLSPEGQGRLIRLAAVWESDGFEKYAADLAASFLKIAEDDSKPDDDRIAAARRLIEFRQTEPQAVEDLLTLVTPQASPDLAVGLIEAVGRSKAEEAGTAVLKSLSGTTPAARQAGLRVLLSRPAWTRALVGGIEAGELPLSDLTLDQRQTLANHPDTMIAEQATMLLSQGGGLTTPNRQKVIDELSPLVLRGGDPIRGRRVYSEQCAKCHRQSGEGTEVGPDLTGMAAHPREELLIHILDPSRSVEGNFRQYTVVTTAGMVLNGMLASESRTSIELIDAEGKRHAVIREDIEELVASDQSVMPEGFEKLVPAESIADLLAFLTQRGRFLPLDLRKVATISSDRGMFFTKESETERLIFPDWSPKEFEGVPFRLIDPQGGLLRNIILLHGPNGTIPPQMPESVRLPVHSRASAIHLLGGVAGWGFPFGERGSVSMIVRLHYADGSTEDHELLNGIHIADYIRVVDVPESKLAFRLRDQQVRYLAIHPSQNTEIRSVELVKGDDDTAPIVMAITVEGRSAD